MVNIMARMTAAFPCGETRAAEKPLLLGVGCEANKISQGGPPVSPRHVWKLGGDVAEREPPTLWDSAPTWTWDSFV